MTDQMDRTIERRGWRRLPLRLVAGVGVAAAVVAGVLVIGLGSAHRSTRVPQGNVTIDTVRADVFHDITTLQGKVAPKDTVYLDALEGGQVRELLAQAGDTVVAGQPLIVFRNTQLELEVLDQEGRLVESITQLQAYERQLEQNRANNEQALETIDYNVQRLGRMADRRAPLARVGFAPREQTEQIADELAYNLRLRPLQTETNARQEALRRRQLPQIRAELASLQQSLAITRNKLDDLTVRAPISGRLTVMDLKIGQNRNRGERLAELTLNTGFKVAASVDEYYLGRVQDGQSAVVEVEGRDWPLTVTRIYPQVQGGVFTVDLAFRGATPAGLTPGQALQGRLTLGADRPGLVLPAGAFLERTGGDWAFVVSADGRHADRRRIRIGRRNAEQAEVLAGLRPGERVITSDYQGWEKLDRIELTP